MLSESTPCFDLLHDAANAERRLDAALHTVASFQDYRKLLEGLQQLDPAARANCSDLAAAAADRAFEVELNGRVLIKHTLDTLNSLRDGGVLYQELGKAAETLSRMTADELKDLLHKEAEQAQKKYGDAAANLFTEATRAMEQLELTFSVKEGQILIDRKSVNGSREQVAVATTRQAGQLGRVSAEEFFNGWGGSLFVSPNQVYQPLDCHHRPLPTGTKAQLATDLYAGAVGSLATTKNLLYQHARRVAELGPRGLRGEDPVTAVLIAIAVVGAGVAIYGVANGNGFLVVFGALLIVGAALVAFGAYTLIVALLV